MIDKERLEEIEEQWKDIEGYEGCYKISNSGRVKSFKHTKNGRILSPKFNGHYNQIRLCKDGECTMFSIHRLVATHFVDNPLNKEQVNHIDGNKTNNFYKNLEWVTHSENGLHAYETRLRVSQKGEDHGRAKLTEKEVLAIFYLVQTGKFEQKEIADMFNIHLATVSDIKLRKKWKHITNIAKQAERIETLNEQLETALKAKDQAISYNATLENRIARNEDLEEHVKDLKIMLKVLGKKNQRYKQALKFYAAGSTYKDWKIFEDAGEKALRALEETE